MTTEIVLSDGNLPAEPNSFVGRERDLAELALLLSDVRVLTLCGPGGIGKTRLALRLAREIVTGFPDGAWLVELADTEDPVLVPAAYRGRARDPGGAGPAADRDADRGAAPAADAADPRHLRARRRRLRGAGPAVAGGLPASCA